MGLRHGFARQALGRQTRQVERECSFDGLVGPTHHYAGLSRGNLASESHAGEVSNPRAAALEGLSKMRQVASLGGVQGVLPPHERPDLCTLRRLGFRGSDAQVLERAHRQAPDLLSAVSSASSMWAANAATVAPSSDTEDGLVHFTPANLIAMPHRSLEPPTTTAVLRALFCDPARFVVHDPLPAHPSFGDEGAANHTRLSTSQGAVHLFAWGHAPGAAERPSRFVARQARAASEAVARLHRLSRARTLLWQQSPRGIDAGAFHTDVLAVGSGSLLLVHEAAFMELVALQRELLELLGDELQMVVATERELPIDRAVAAYPFNSQLVTREDGSMALLAPKECEVDPASRAFLERVLSETPRMDTLSYVDVNGSMRNGGGPACLRLRVPLKDEERASVLAPALFTPALDQALSAWIGKHYRDRLTLSDLADASLLDESRRALDELTELLGLGSLYAFQR